MQNGVTLFVIFTNLYLFIFTSAEEVMFLPDFVCLCVSKITQKVPEGSF